MRPLLLLLPLLSALPATADSPGIPIPWTSTSKSKQYVLRFDPNSTLTKAEQNANRARLELLTGKLKRRTASAAELLEHQQLSWAPSGLVERLTLEKDGLLVWSATRGVPSGVGVVTDDGVSAIISGRLPSAAARGGDPSPALTILGTDGVPVRALRLDELCSSEELTKLSFSKSHVTWLQSFRLDDERGQLVLTLFNGYVPPIYQQPPGVERRVQLPSGAIVD